MSESEIPVVLDADGLNAFEGQADDINGQRPHAGDYSSSGRNGTFGRLFDR